MGFHGSHIDVPQRIRAPLQHAPQLLRHHFRRDLQHGDMVGRLQIVEAHMIVDPIASRFFFSGHGVCSGIQILLTAGDHSAESVVSPDFDDVLRHAQIALPVQHHQLAVQVGGKAGLGIPGQRQLHLAAHDGGDKRPPLLIRIITAVVVIPERVVSLSPESDAPHHPPPGVAVHGLLPESFIFFRIQGIAGRQIRIHPSEHSGPQNLAVMLRNPQSHVQGHVRQHPAVIFPVRARNDHVSATPQNRLKGPFPHLVPQAFFHMPSGKQHFVVDEPAPVPHPVGG